MLQSTSFFYRATISSILILLVIGCTQSRPYPTPLPRTPYPTPTKQSAQAAAALEITPLPLPPDGTFLMTHAGYELIAAPPRQPQPAHNSDPLEPQLYLPLVKGALADIDFDDIPFEAITIDPFATGFLSITDIQHAGDERLFVVERDGRIFVVDALGQYDRNTPFLDIRDRVEYDDFWEQGLLGLAFHPNYAHNGYFYVYYTELADNANHAPVVVTRFQTDPTNLNQAAPNTAYEILRISQPSWFHQAGGMQFGPDGYLYIGIGDGGQESMEGQSLTSLLGSIIRINIDTDDPQTPYTIPADNPFVQFEDARDEIWQFGVRNPWRISFDTQTGDFYIGDVGDQGWEEINFAAAGTNGRNFGWPCYQGRSEQRLDECEWAPGYRFPIFEYAHEDNYCAVTGGYVYRGQRFINMQGYYFFADFCTGQIWAASRNQADEWHIKDLGTFTNEQGTGNSWSTFGQDVNGELYVARQFSNGIVFKIKQKHEEQL